jgi:oxygen-independent coproporphyrinogen-3 oxidase
LKETLPEQIYVDALLKDLHQQKTLATGRDIQTVFIGGGTPSLFGGKAISRLLQGIREQINLSDKGEITLEANPGTVDAEHFSAYRKAGVNRLSIGVQSFNAIHLQALGRIHTPDQAQLAVAVARDAGFKNINLDLMFGLPGQNIGQALEDLQQAIALSPGHISWYQLTIEPNTLFYHQPPPAPEDDLLWDMQQQGQKLLASAGYEQYEISAYANTDGRCRHNLNYWSFGDYLAIGAGAHGKVSTKQGVMRYSRLRHPRNYIDSAARPVEMKRLQRDDLRLEFMMNAMRLNNGVPQYIFRQRTGLLLTDIARELSKARNFGLLHGEEGILRSTVKGRTYLNDLLMIFDQ